MGAHDENISPEQAAKIVGEKYAGRIEKLALDLYKTGAEYARARGIIIADVKFEFGLDETTDEIVLIDEVLTPDSSRFWPADKYEYVAIATTNRSCHLREANCCCRVGRDQESFDKQYLRNW